ncbi:MAG: hypothetical protein LBT53_05775 [Puniceicoccales bacterium]|jgi:hypothetical protein|nr:hypothetical protein [Puniceicoccales bacterium]
MKKHLFHFLLTLACVTGLTACAGKGGTPGLFSTTVYYAYDGPARPTSEVATLFWPSRGNGFDFFSIDAEFTKEWRRVPRGGSLLGRVYIDIEPGLHDFVLDFLEETTTTERVGTMTRTSQKVVRSKGLIYFSATLKPGQIYEIVADPAAYNKDERIVPKLTLRNVRPRPLVSAEKSENAEKTEENKKNEENEEGKETKELEK